MSKMKVAVVQNVGDVQIVEMDKPQASPGTVVLRVKACALCTVEQRAYSGAKKFPYPMIGGHEFSGIIEEVGEGVIGDWKVGDHAVGTFSYCGECYYCRRGYGNQCENTSKAAKRVPGFAGMIIGGGLSEYVVIPTNQLVKFGNDLAFEQAALSEPLGCCIHSVEKADVQLGDDVVVIGGGIMGMFHCLLAKMKGARVILAELDPKRREFAEKNGYAHITYDPTAVDAVEFIKGLTNGRGADAIFNTTPFPTVASDAIALSGKLGKTVMYSSISPDDPQPVKMGVLHSMENEIIGTVSPAQYDMFRATKMMENGIIDVKPFIEKTVDFENVKDALEHAVKPNTYRVVVTHK